MDSMQSTVCLINAGHPLCVATLRHFGLGNIHLWRPYNFCKIWLPLILSTCVHIRLKLPPLPLWASG